MAQATQTTLTIHSPAFSPGGAIPAKHTEDGQDVSPPLSWSNLPQGTQELALIVEDPDAPRDEPWVHWVMYGIPADAGGLPGGIPTDERLEALGGAMQGRNTWGTIGYRGPAPPKGHGTHHYHFVLFALGRPLNLKAGAEKKDLLQAMDGQILARAELVGTYER